jgi:hypothetical protein
VGTVGLLIWNPENKEACEAYLETSVFNSKFCVGRGGCVTAMVFTGIILSCHFEILRTSVHILVDCSLFGILLVPFMVSQMLTFLLFATNLCRIFLLLMTSRLAVVLVRIAVKCVSCCILMTTTQWNHPKPSCNLPVQIGILGFKVSNYCCVVLCCVVSFRFVSFRFLKEKSVRLFG